MPSREAARLRALAEVLRGQRAIQAGVRKALDRLLAYASRNLAESGYDASSLDARAQAWRAALTQDVEPAIYGVFRRAFTTASRGDAIDPEVYATRYIESTTNRLVGVADEVFDVMRLELETGRRAGESIPQLAARVDSLLTDDQRWANRAQTIARTEVVGANNAGAADSAVATARTLGVAAGEVVKEWMATVDARTRETHAEADGQTVLGLDTPFIVGGVELQQPGDPFGDPAETINCRCVATYIYPGDPDYPAGGITAAGATQEDTMDPLTAAIGEDHEDDTTVWVALLPTPGDPVHGIGPEDPKHATLLFLGEAATLPADAEEVLSTALAAAANGATATMEETVTGVEPLGEDGAQVWMLAGDTAPAFRDTILADATVAGYLDNAEQYPEFQPHVTIGYAADPEEPDAPAVTPEDLTAAEAVTSITFDRVALWWAGTETTWQMAAAPPEETPVEPVTAAAGDPAPTPPVTMDASEPAPIPSEDVLLEDDLGDQFYGICTVENSQTGDGRVFAPGAITWDGVPFPMPAGWQVQDAPGHDGSVICGRIDSMIRFGNLIGYTGTWDLDGAGWETRRLVAGEFLTGLSVDTDDFDAEVVTQDGDSLDMMDMMFGDPGDAVLLVTRARVRSWAMCRVPAFTEAFISNGTPPPGWAGERPTAVLETDPASEVPGEVGDTAPPAEEVAAAALVAAAERAGNPARFTPPAAHFQDPGLTALTSLTVDDDGRVYGHLAAWGTCHIGYDGVCVVPPESSTDYAYYAKGRVRADDGNDYRVGPITIGTGHAPPNVNAHAAVAHYDNTGAVVASVCIGEDDLGIWFSGHLSPNATDAQVYDLRAAGAVSGDWRECYPGAAELDLVASLVVNVPGFPIGRPQIAASGGRQTALVAAGVIRPAAPAPPPFSPADFARLVSGEVRRSMARRDVTARLEAQATAARLRRLRTVTTRLDRQEAR